jgi:hypothetical protein
MEARFREDGITIGCTKCEMDFTNPDVPSGILDGHPKEDVPLVVDRWLKRVLHSLDYGFCELCDGSVAATVYLPDDPDAPEWVDGEQFDARVRYDCPRCNETFDSMIPAFVVVHPAVVRFLCERGIDIRTTPMWEFDWIRPRTTTVLSEDPLRVEVPITAADETHRFVFDADLELVAERDN